MFHSYISNTKSGHITINHKNVLENDIFEINATFFLMANTSLDPNGLNFNILRDVWWVKINYARAILIGIFIPNYRGINQVHIRPITTYFSYATIYIIFTSMSYTFYLRTVSRSEWRDSKIYVALERCLLVLISICVTLLCSWQGQAQFQAPCRKRWK